MSQESQPGKGGLNQQKVLLILAVAVNQEQPSYVESMARAVGLTQECWSPSLVFTMTQPTLSADSHQDCSNHVRSSKKYGKL